jgi:poly(A) polymerase
VVFDTTILGSNPSAPAKIMMKETENFLLKIKKRLFPFYKSKEASLIFKTLQKGEPREKKVVMFVGGCVRKYIEDQEIDDIDIATIFSPREIKEKFNNTGVKIIDTGIEHGSITLLINKSRFEITTLRKDIKNYGRHADVSFTEDWIEDSNRRDFTINAIYLDNKGKIFDPHSGIKDLKNKVVKFIGEPSIEEDYLRIIRYIRFCIQYDSNIDHSTLESIKLNLNGIKSLSKERILNELFKIISLNNFKNINQNKNLKNIFSIIFPELKYIERMAKFQSVSSLFKLSEIFTLTILLIDSSNNYEYFCHKYKTSNLIKEELNLAAQLLKLYVNDKNFLEKNLKKNIYLFGKEKINQFYWMLFFIYKKISVRDCQILTDKIHKINIPKFPLDGKYLIKQGLTEGKKIGYVLKELEKSWIENNYNLPEKIIIDKINEVKLDIFNP